jgi:hypothetical protein
MPSCGISDAHILLKYSRFPSLPPIPANSVTNIGREQSTWKVLHKLGAGVVLHKLGARVRIGAVGWGAALHSEGREFHSLWGPFFRPHYGREINLASNGNECQGYLLACKGGQWVRLTTLPPSCPECLDILDASTSGNPKVLSRSVMGYLYLLRACR